jgi:type II secretory pathway pseudopilin PulG
MSTHTRPKSIQAGHTLIELAIALGVLGLVLGSLTSVFESSRKAYRQGSTAALVQSDARRALDGIAARLENAGFATLVPNPVNVAVDDLLFQVSTGFDEAAGTIIFGPSTRLCFVYADGETDNGIDDDGNGLVDDGRVVLTINYLQPGEISVTLARGVCELLQGELANGVDDNGNGLVDERGFCITRNGNLLLLRLSVARATPAVSPIIATVETALRLKN